MLSCRNLDMIDAADRRIVTSVRRDAESDVLSSPSDDRRCAVDAEERARGHASGVRRRYLGNSLIKQRDVSCIYILNAKLPRRLLCT